MQIIGKLDFMVNTMLWNKLLLAVILILSGQVKSEEHLLYSLRIEMDNIIQLSAINLSSKKKILPFNFCLSSVGDLEFEIVDLVGGIYKMQAFLNDRCDLKRGIFIEPFSMVGKVFHKEEIKSYYKLPSAEFYIKARLCRVKNICVETNSMKLSYKK